MRELKQNRPFLEVHLNKLECTHKIVKMASFFKDTQVNY